MSQAATEYERLRVFLSDLSPQARDALVAALGRPDAADLLPRREMVLQALEDARRENGELPQRAIDALLAPLDPFLVDYVAPVQTPGLIARAHRRAFAALIAEDIAPELVARVDETLRTADPDGARAFIAASQDVLAQRIDDHLGDRSGERHDALAARLGGDTAVADLEDALTLLQRRAMLGPLDRDIRSLVKPGGEEALKSVRARMAVIMDRSPDLLPFALALARKRLPGPEAFARLAVLGAGKAEGAAISASPYASVLDLLVAELEACVAGTPEGDARTLAAACASAARIVTALTGEIRLPRQGAHQPRIDAARAELETHLQGALLNLQPRIRGLLHVPGGEKAKALKAGDVTRIEADMRLLGAVAEAAETLEFEHLVDEWLSESRESLSLMAREIIAKSAKAEGPEAKAWKSRADALARLAKPIADDALAPLVAQAQKATAEAAPSKRSA